MVSCATMGMGHKICHIPGAWLSGLSSADPDNQWSSALGRGLPDMGHRCPMASPWDWAGESSRSKTETQRYLLPSSKGRTPLDLAGLLEWQGKALLKSWIMRSSWARCLVLNPGLVHPYADKWLICQYQDGATPAEGHAPHSIYSAIQPSHKIIPHLVNCFHG